MGQGVLLPKAISGIAVNAATVKEARQGRFA
jgi:hypothetical protein